MNLYKDKYKIFDMHTHAYPDGISEKARINLGKFYNFEVCHSPTVNALTDMQRFYGSSGFCLFSVATSREQTVKINNWLHKIMTEHSGEDLAVACFASMQQDMSDKEKTDEVERVIGLGFKGVKIHPDIQRVEADSEKLFALYEAIEGRIALYIHAGDARYDFSSPKKIARIKKRFPKLMIIAAHLGGYQRWEEVEEVYGEKDIYFDTSSTLWALNPERTREIIMSHDCEKIFFGTDYPVKNIGEELELLEKLELNDEILEKILYKNASKFLGLEL